MDKINLIELGFTGDIKNVYSYNLNQKSVYGVVGLFFRDVYILITKQNVELLVSIMATIRYINDLVDLYGIDELMVIEELDQTKYFEVFDFIFFCVKCSGDIVSFKKSCKKVLFFSKSQRKSKSISYIKYRIYEGHFTGMMLFYAINKSFKKSLFFKKIFFSSLSIASNLWDTLLDLKEDKKMNILMIIFLPLLIFIFSAASILFCPKIFFVISKNKRFLQRFYFHKKAKH